MRISRASLDGYRKAVVTSIEKGEPAEYVAASLNALARAEGYVMADEYLDSAYQDSGTPAMVAAALELLSRGPDDGWSGRTNDVRRAQFDGVREAISDRRFRREMRVDPLPDTDTVDAAGFDGTGRDGHEPWTWKALALALLEERS